MDNQEQEITLETVNTCCNNTNNHHGTKLKHYHSVPIQQKRDTIINPHIFRLSRSNIYNNVEKETLSTTTKTVQSSSSSSSSSCWNINNNNIKIFPPYLEMERTHCIIQHDGLYNTPNDIANHISTYLKGVAVSTLYDDENAVAHVEFKHELRILIRLFKMVHGNDTTSASSSSSTTCPPDGGERSYGKDNYNDCILVEVVRREGCSAQFHREARRILHVAEGLDICALDDDVEDDLSMKKVLNVPKELRREYLDQFKITDYTANSLT